MVLSKILVVVVVVVAVFEPLKDANVGGEERVGYLF